VWEVINKLLNNHLQKVGEETMVRLVEKVLERMSGDIQKYKQRKIKTTANVNSGLELLRKVLTQPTFTSTKPTLLQ